MNKYKILIISLFSAAILFISICVSINSNGFNPNSFKVPDVVEYLKQVKPFQIVSGSEKSYKFPDGSALTIKSIITPLGLHPSSKIVIHNSKAKNIASGANIFSQTNNDLGDNYYVADNRIIETFGSSVNSIDFKVWYESLLFKNTDGKTLGYGAYVYSIFPDVRQDGYTISKSNGKTEEQNNGSRYANIFRNFTIGFNVDGNACTNTWQMHIYWDSSRVSAAPLWSNFTNSKG